MDFEAAIQNAFRRRDARQQFRWFARPNQVLRHSPAPLQPVLLRFSAKISQDFTRT